MLAQEIHLLLDLVDKSQENDIDGMITAIDQRKTNILESVEPTDTVLIKQNQIDELKALLDITKKIEMSDVNSGSSSQAVFDALVQRKNVLMGRHIDYKGQLVSLVDGAPESKD